MISGEGKRSNARLVLSYARFFLKNANLPGMNNREEVEAYIAAAIIFGRSITFYIQKEYKHLPGFDSWYSAQRKMLSNYPVYNFFLKARNIILKEGPVGVRRMIQLSCTIAVVTATSTVELRVLREKPWYRRNLKIIWEDLRTSLMRLFRKFRRSREIAKSLTQTNHKPSTQPNVFYYFDDPACGTKPALELLREYLDTLERIVSEAEAQFGVGSQ